MSTRFVPHPRVLVLLVLHAVGSTGSVQAAIKKGPALAESPYYKTGKKDDPAEERARIRFVAKIQEGVPLDPEKLSDAAMDQLKVADEAKAEASHLWDKETYYWPLAQERERWLILGWHNKTDNVKGWVAISHTPFGFYLRTAENRYLLEDGESKTITWSTRGDDVTITVKNPRDKDDWKPEDVQYSFGY